MSFKLRLSAPFDKILLAVSHAPERHIRYDLTRSINAKTCAGPKTCSYSAFVAMITFMNIDTIYWLSDFKDNKQDAVVERLEKLLIEKGVTLHVQSVNKKVPEHIIQLAEKSGGKVIIQ